jgi:hypothetical protein
MKFLYAFTAMLLFAIYLPSSASALPITIEAEVILSSRNCDNLAFSDDCTVNPPSLFVRPNAINSDISRSINSDLGSASAHVQQLDDGRVIQLSVNMASSSQSRNGATAQIIQKFQWLGENNALLPFNTAFSFSNSATDILLGDANTSGGGVVSERTFLVDLSYFDESFFIGYPFLGSISCGDSGVLAREGGGQFYGTTAGSILQFDLKLCYPNIGDVRLMQGVNYGLLSSVYTIGNRGASGEAVYTISYTGRAEDLALISPPNTVVPEPATAGLLMLGIMAAIKRRQRY